MADRLPNYQNEIRRLRVEVMQTELNIEKNKLRVCELGDEIARIEESTGGLEAALTEQREKLAALEKEHGKK